MTEAAIENHPIDALTQRRVDHIVEVFNTLDIDAIVALFSEDVVVTYADRPLLRGREALRAFIAPRYADLVDYRLSKRIRMEQGPGSASRARRSIASPPRGPTAAGTGHACSSFCSSATT